MRATLWLFNKHFWKSIYGPVMAFVFPPLLLAIMGHIMNITYVLPGIISMGIMFIGILSMPLFIMEMKGSTLLKYVGSSPLNSKRFTGSVIVFYLLISILSVMNLLFFGMFLFWNKVFPDSGFNTGLYSGIFSAFGSFSFWIANVLNITMSLSIGLLIVTYTKTVQRALTIGLMIAIPSMFLAGMVVPVDVIAKSKAMQIISHISPFRYTTGLLVVSTTPIPQTGDFLGHISPENLRLIFKDVKDNGAIGIVGLGTAGKYYVSSLEQLSAVMDKFKATDGNLDRFIRDNIMDEVLFDQIFMSMDLNHISETSNNIFNIIQPWGVRKLPDTDMIVDFASDYLINVGSTDAVISGSSSLSMLQARIDQRDMSWIELFTEQTVILYSTFDMILNIGIPIALPAFATYAAVRRFRWSSR